ncbi:MAG: hypothetical protein EBV65_06475 [Gammaproteobacteria bacterium]|nr:hypothetical protein [Gammaproteobacteria bacterium]
MQIRIPRETAHTLAKKRQRFEPIALQHAQIGERDECARSVFACEQRTQGRLCFDDSSDTGESRSECEPKRTAGGVLLARLGEHVEGGLTFAGLGEGLGEQDGTVDSADAGLRCAQHRERLVRLIHF